MADQCSADHGTGQVIMSSGGWIGVDSVLSLRPISPIACNDNLHAMVSFPSVIFRTRCHSSHQQQDGLAKTSPSRFLRYSLITGCRSPPPGSTHSSWTSSSHPYPHHPHLSSRHTHTSTVSSTRGPLSSSYEEHAAKPTWHLHPEGHHANGVTPLGWALMHMAGAKLSQQMFAMQLLGSLSFIGL